MPVLGLATYFCRSVKRRLVRKARLVGRRLTVGQRVLPGFLIVGARKAGTTSLYRYLLQHPQVTPGFVKESRYFGEKYSRGPRWYRSLFPTREKMQRIEAEHGGPVLTLDADVDMMFYPHAARRVAELLPHVRSVMLLRNPVDRAYSQYCHVARRGDEPLTFEEAVDREAERLAPEIERMLRDEEYYSRIHFDYSYLARGVYADQVERWWGSLPENNLMIIQSEEMFADPRATYSKVLEFLGLPSFEPASFETHNQGKTQAPMSPETRRKLAEYFAPHNERLYSLLGERYDWH